MSDLIFDYNLAEDLVFRCEEIANNSKYSITLTPILINKFFEKIHQSKGLKGRKTDNIVCLYTFIINTTFSEEFNDVIAEFRFIDMDCVDGIELKKTLYQQAYNHAKFLFRDGKRELSSES